MTDKIVVLITCGSEKEAKQLAHALVDERLAACVNIHVAPVHSVYRWKGKVEEAREWLLTIKTTRRRFAAFCATVERLHSYAVPEIIALPIAAGSKKYLAWVAETAAQPKGATTKRSAKAGR